MSTILDLDQTLTPLAALERFPEAVLKPVGDQVADQVAALHGLGGLTVTDRRGRWGESPTRTVRVTGTGTAVTLFWSRNWYSGRDNGWAMDREATWAGRRYRRLLRPWTGTVRPDTAELADRLRDSVQYLLDVRGPQPWLTDHDDVRAWLGVVDDAAEALAAAQQQADDPRFSWPRVDAVVRPVFDAAHPVAARTGH